MVAAFRREMAQRLRPYDGVQETLSELRAGGRVIVAHTDAMMAYADLRLEQLGLSGLIDELVATEDHPVPAGARDDLSYLPLSRFREHSAAQHTSIPTELRKPHPQPLLALLTRYNVRPQEALYVGDSLFRDVAMAQAAGIVDVYAAYGRSYAPELWQRLVDVTHWTAEDVRREQLLASAPVKPSHRVNSFRALIDVVDRLDRP